MSGVLNCLFTKGNLSQKSSKDCDISHKPPPKQGRLWKLVAQLHYINPEVDLT